MEKYGLRCLVTLARHGVGEQLSISDIAEMEGLSIPYTSKVLSALRQADLVVAARGRSGGFSIARDPKEIKLYDIITALGGPIIDSDHCTKHTGQKSQCVHVGRCSVHDVLAGLAGYIQYYLSLTTLQDLLSDTGMSFQQLGDRARRIATVEPLAAVEKPGAENVVLKQTARKRK